MIKDKYMLAIFFCKPFPHPAAHRWSHHSIAPNKFIVESAVFITFIIYTWFKLFWLCLNESEVRSNGL